MMDTKPMDLAFAAAMEAAAPGYHRAPRQRWKGQNNWDRANMVTESTRFTRAQDARLRRCCHEAKVNRNQLIAYMLHTWMAAWEAARKEDGHGSDTPVGDLRH